MRFPGLLFCSVLVVGLLSGCGGDKASDQTRSDGAAGASARSSTMLPVGLPVMLDAIRRASVIVRVAPGVSLFAASNASSCSIDTFIYLLSRYDLTFFPHDCR